MSCLCCKANCLSIARLCDFRILHLKVNCQFSFRFCADCSQLLDMPREISNRQAKRQRRAMEAAAAMQPTMPCGMGMPGTQMGMQPTMPCGMGMPSGSASMMMPFGMGAMGPMGGNWMQQQAAQQAVQQQQMQMQMQQQQQMMQQHMQQQMQQQMQQNMQQQMQQLTHDVSSEDEDDFLNGDDSSSSAAGQGVASSAVVQAMTAGPAASAAPAGSAGDESNIPPPMMYDKSDEASISRSSSLLKGIPRRRLTAALGKLHREFEAGYLNELSQRGLLILLWLLTRLRPCARISHLSAWSLQFK